MSDGGEQGPLPDGWVQAPLSDLLAALESGKRPRGGVRGMTDGVPSLGGEHLTYAGSFDFSKIKHVPRDFAAAMKRGRIQRGDVLVVKDGATTGKTALVGDNFPYDDAFANEHLFVCRPSTGISPKYLATYLRSPMGQERILDHFQGSAQGGINQSFASGTVVPVPPPAEQVRIAERLDEIEQRRMSVVARLLAARAVLDRLRRAVLAAACSGRLSAAWRNAYPEANTDQLHAVLIEARKTVKPRKSRSGEERGLTSQSQLDLLPPSWSLVRLGDILEVGTGATPLRKNPSYYDGGTIAWVTSGAVNAGTITEPTELITPLALKETNVKLFPPGTLLVAMYGEGQTRGRVAELGIEAGTNQAVAAVLFAEATDPLRPFLRLFFEDSYQRVRALSVGGVQPNLNVGMIKDTLLPLPPLGEQAEILRRAAAGLAAADRLASRIGQVEATLDRVSRATLAKAFRGELVPTEASLAAEAGRDFEPAEKVLARIEGEHPARRQRASA